MYSFWDVAKNFWIGICIGNARDRKASNVLFHDFQMTDIYSLLGILQSHNQYASPSPISSGIARLVRMEVLLPTCPSSGQRTRFLKFLTIHAKR